MQVGESGTMSSQEQFSADGGAPPHTANPPPDCPGCNRPMTLRQVSPVLSASDIDDAVYGCAACGAETKRSVKR
jgi:hypothetical protein